jgi:hypothetical protein
VDPQPRGPDWMQITPKAGFLFHAYSQVYRLIVGEIVERLQHQCLEDHDFIPRLASRRILAFRFARNHRRKLQADRSFR